MYGHSKSSFKNEMAIVAAFLKSINLFKALVRGLWGWSMFVSWERLGALSEKRGSSGQTFLFSSNALSLEMLTTLNLWGLSSILALLSFKSTILYGPTHFGVSLGFFPKAVVSESQTFCSILNLCGAADWSKLSLYFRPCCSAFLRATCLACCNNCRRSAGKDSP